MPSRSRAACAGDGEPCGRAWRYGRLKRRTHRPASVKASATAFRSAALQSPPAPCVIASPSPDGFAGSCSQPLTSSRSNDFAANFALPPNCLASHAGPAGDLEIRNELAEISFVLCHTDEAAERVPLARAAAEALHVDMPDLAAGHLHAPGSRAHIFEIEIEWSRAVQGAQRTHAVANAREQDAEFGALPAFQLSRRHESDAHPSGVLIPLQ